MRYVPYPSNQTPMYNGTPYQSGVPPTIGNIGGYGYNNSYQNGYYNQYFNPMYIRQQQEEQARLVRQQQETQINTWKRLIKCSNNALGYEYDEQVVDKQIHDAIRFKQKMNHDEAMVNDVHLIVQKSLEKQQQEQTIAANIENDRQMQLQQTDVEQKSFYRWLHEDAQEAYMRSQYAELNKQRHNVSNIYDSNGYRQLLGIHDSAFNSLNAEVTIDDMEIQVTLPEHLKRDRDIRRQQFAEALRST